MKLIAHRGLISGPDKLKENTIDQINLALTYGFDVEIDVWYFDNQWFLGHDNPQTVVDLTFLDQPKLWIHAKNANACFKLNELYHNNKKHLNYFWHENDARTLTSQGYIWTYPNKELTNYSIGVMPEWNISIENLNICKSWNCYAICSDYVSIICK